MKIISDDTGEEIEIGGGLAITGGVLDVVNNGLVRIYNPTTDTYYTLTLTGVAGEEILTYTPE